MDQNIVHLGDGVYVGFDGYHIVIRVNDHRTEPVVFFDFETMERLVEYYQRKKEAIIKAQAT